MSKFFLPPPGIERDHILINEDLWFQINQRWLLNMANTSYGRDLLCIPKEYPRIVLFKKNCVHCLLENNGKTATIVADFRVGAKWANVIRSRWEQFKSYARYFQYEQDYSIPMSKMTREALAMSCDTLTAYPDPHTETTTVDGHVLYENSATWATAHDANQGNAFSDSGTAFSAGASTVLFEIFRTFTLFDTSTITSGGTISAAILSLYAISKLNDYNDGTDYINIYTTTPASNTALENADYVQIGTTAQATAIDLGDITTSAYNDWTLSATGRGNISKTGVTKFGVREGHDAENSALTAPGTSRMVAASADTSNTTSDPKLVITYTIAVAATGNFLLFF